MAKNRPKSKGKFYERHLRAETVVVNGTMIVFFRDRKKRRWNWRAFDADVTLSGRSPPNTSRRNDDPETEPSPGGENKTGFLAKHPMPLRIRRADDNKPIDDAWLRSEGHSVHLTNGVVIPLDDDGPQWGAVLVRSADGWLFESPWPKYRSVMLVPQPKTRADLRRVIATLIACRRNRGSLDIDDALCIGFSTRGIRPVSI